MKRTLLFPYPVFLVLEKDAPDNHEDEGRCTALNPGDEPFVCTYVDSDGEEQDAWDVSAPAPVIQFTDPRIIL